MEESCSYCEKSYKKDLIEPPNCIGGYINGYWFCKQCIQYGFKNKSKTDKHQILLLLEYAEKHSSKSYNINKIDS